MNSKQCYEKQQLQRQLSGCLEKSQDSVCLCISHSIETGKQTDGAHSELQRESPQKTVTMAAHAAKPRETVLKRPSQVANPASH